MASLELSRRFFLGSLAAVGLAGCGRGPRPRAGYAGGFDEPSHARGHRLRDGSLPAPPPRGGERTVDVAILGGGMTGLSAAWALDRAGFESYELLELEPAPGGTSRSGRNHVSRFPWGAHYVPAPTPGNRPLAALLEEVGALVGWDAAGRPVYDEAALIREPAERVFYRGEWFEGLYPIVGAGPGEREQLDRFEEAMRGWARWRDERGRRAFALPRARGSDARELQQLDGLSMGDWLERHGFDSPRLRWLVDYSCRDDFGASAASTSAWAGIHYFTSRDDESDETSGEFLTWPEGNGRLVDHLAGRAADRLQLGALVAAVEPDEDGVRVVWYESPGETPRALRARHVVFALPRFQAAHLIAPWREAPPAFLAETVYGSWVVANVTLSGRPAGRGFELAWDNVIHDSPSLGYVVATHQSGRDHGPTVLTWYLPVTGADPRLARARLLETSWEEWAALALDDLRTAHPGIDALVERIDVCRWGHAMVWPRPGFLWSEALERSSRPLGRVRFAHTDLSGMALFEESQYWGIRAAEAVMRERGHPFESWL